MQGQTLVTGEPGDPGPAVTLASVPVTEVTIRAHRVTPALATPRPDGSETI